MYLDINLIQNVCAISVTSATLNAAVILPAIPTLYFAGKTTTCVSMMGLVFPFVPSFNKPTSMSSTCTVDLGPSTQSLKGSYVSTVSTLSSPLTGLRSLLSKTTSTINCHPYPQHKASRFSTLT